MCGIRNTDTRELRDEPHCCNKMQISPIYNPVSVIQSAEPSDDSCRVCINDTEVATIQNAGEIHTAVIEKSILTDAPRVETQVAHQQHNRPERYVPHGETQECSVTNNAPEVRATTEISSMNSAMQRYRHCTMRQLATNIMCKYHNVFLNRQPKVTLVSAAPKSALCAEPLLVEHVENFYCTKHDDVRRRIRQEIVQETS